MKEIQEIRILPTEPVIFPKGVSAVTYRELFRDTRQRLQGAGADAAQMEAYLLLEAGCGVDRTHYPLIADTLCPQESQEKLRELLRRRLNGEPIQYVLGKWEFYGYEFEVGPGVLIPRAETELLVETVLEYAEHMNAVRIADLCSGSGCIAISLARQRPDASVWALEASPEALSYLRRNAALNQCGNVRVLQEDVLAPQGDYPILDAIVSNPPYIPTAELPSLQREVQFEPAMALDGDGDGLRFYRRLGPVWLPRLRPGGLVAYEIGAGQGQAVKALLETQGAARVRVLKDLAGLDRVVCGVKPL